MVLTTLVLMIATAGCAWKGGDNPAPTAEPPQNGWQATPAKIRVYPSTRFVRDGDAIVLEARVELLDEMGDSSKGVGRFNFELFPPPRARLDPVGTRLYAWTVELLTLEDQRGAYDPIARAYLFRLKVDGSGVAGKDTVLHVTFVPAAGPRLEAQATIPGQAKL